MEGNMTNLEITKLCAEAMGLVQYQLEGLGQNSAYGIYAVNSTDKGYFAYQPLEDDTQAMALVEKFGLDLSHDIDKIWTVCRSTPKLSKQGCESEDISLKRAICLCVAKMQLSKFAE